MKYLSDYTNEAITKALNKAGAFYAFSDKQFEEAKKEGVEYSRLGMGLVCPKENAKKLVESIEKAIDVGRKQDLKENGKSGVIKRELANYEAYYTGDISDTVEVLKNYGITRNEILEVFKIEKAKSIYY